MAKKAIEVKIFEPSNRFIEGDGAGFISEADFRAILDGGDTTVVDVYLIPISVGTRTGAIKRLSASEFEVVAEVTYD